MLLTLFPISYLLLLYTLISFLLICAIYFLFKIPTSYIRLTPQSYTDSLQTLLNRTLEWALTSPPKPHAFVSLPLQSDYNSFIELINTYSEILINEFNIELEFFYSNLPSVDLESYSNMTYDLVDDESTEYELESVNEYFKWKDSINFPSLKDKEYLDFLNNMDYSKESFDSNKYFNFNDSEKFSQYFGVEKNLDNDYIKTLINNTVINGDTDFIAMPVIITSQPDEIMRVLPVSPGTIHDSFEAIIINSYYIVEDIRNEIVNNGINLNTLHRLRGVEASIFNNSPPSLSQHHGCNCLPENDASGGELINNYNSIVRLIIDACSLVRRINWARPEVEVVEGLRTEEDLRNLMRQFDTPETIQEIINILNQVCNTLLNIMRTTSQDFFNHMFWWL